MGSFPPLCPPFILRREPPYSASDHPYSHAFLTRSKKSQPTGLLTIDTTPQSRISTTARFSCSWRFCLFRFGNTFMLCLQPHTTQPPLISYGFGAK